MCDSDNLAGIEGEYPTGVVAPDGGAEMWRYVGWLCRDCGAREEI